MRNTEKNELRRYLLIFLLPVIVVFLAACQKPSIAFGPSFISNNNTNVLVIDTSTVSLSTVLNDSFPTAGTGSMLLGSYHDNSFGNITASSFFQMGLPAGISAINNMTGFDSIEVIMRLNKTFYGDTSVTQRYYVSRLTDLIQLPYNQYNFQTTFYNNSNFAFEPSPLGYTDIRINPTSAVQTTQNAIDSVKIRLADTLGQNLLAMIIRKSDTITNVNSFIGYFKGLTIYSDTTAAHSGTMYGFKDTVTMRLFYHQPGVFTTYSFLDFKFNNKAYQFNRITADRSSSPLAVLNTLQPQRPNPLIPTEAPSALTANACYVQSATGIQAKIRFPYLTSILAIPDYIGLLNAQLILKPIVGTFSPELSLPPQLILSLTDLNNQLGGTIVSATGGIEYGNLVVDYTYGQNTSYTYDITGYIKQQLTIGGINNDGLMLSLPSPANHTTFDRAVFGDVTNKNYTITLKLYYISLPH